MRWKRISKSDNAGRGPEAVSESGLTRRGKRGILSNRIEQTFYIGAAEKRKSGVLGKKNGIPWRGHRFSGGGGWIRTTEAKRNRFTVCPLWPLGNSSKYALFLKEVWSWWTDSNPRPADYKSAALPAELHQRFKGACPTASAIILKESGIVKHEFQEKKKKERTEKRRKKSDRCIRRCGTSSSFRRRRSAPSVGWSSMGRTRW